MWGTQMWRCGFKKVLHYKLTGAPPELDPITAVTGFHCPGGAQTPTPLGGLWEHFAGSLAPTPRQDGEHSDGTGAEVTHPNKDIHVSAGGPCPPGHFCPVGTGVPLPCPVGTFSDRMFLSTASECLSCPPGYFCGASGLAAPSGPCSPGYFCLAGASSPTPTAAADRLPADTSCAAISSGHSGQGGPCPRGHFCPRGTSPPQPCPAGSYSYLTGQASCFPCPAGYYCPENITNYSGHPCPAGFYCPRASPAPGPGAEGAFRNRQAGLPSSERCFSGTKYATQFPCPRGYYNPDPLTQSLDSCLPCPPGHYCGQENLTRASGPCEAGWFCVSAAWTARPFDLDNYTSTNCLCPATATGGKCPVGSYCPEGSPEPMPCPPGSFCGTSGKGLSCCGSGCGWWENQHEGEHVTTILPCPVRSTACLPQGAVPGMPPGRTVLHKPSLLLSLWVNAGQPPQNSKVGRSGQASRSLCTGRRSVAPPSSLSVLPMSECLHFPSTCCGQPCWALSTQACTRLLLPWEALSSTAPEVQTLG
ncbi:neurogenic locus notch homolog protein 4-like [Papio anubis]|uniref:neurogenic locus notch homolog protein 4-like n=1 Tax=Papio anubis TaxID=9555 RepID=UPI0012AE1AA7|nr:neurogenic locus notch homolog protein 4-like [Papio anubis]